MWFIGNTARDPIARPRCLLLCEPEGLEKSIALGMAAAAMQGATSVTPDNILTRSHSDLEDRIAQIVVKSRLVTCYELDLNRKEVNMSMFKNVTGSDYVKVWEFISKAVCSLAIATNKLPNVNRQPEFTSDALSRRIISLKMNVDTADAPFEPDPSHGLDKVNFHCACLYVMICYSHLSISSDNLLISLCISKYFQALEFVDGDYIENISAMEDRAVISIIAAVMKSEPYRVLERYRLIFISSLFAIIIDDIIKDIRLRRDGEL